MGSRLAHGNAQVMKKLPNHTALKEWASVIDALGRGEQIILIRKGGLADPKFGLEADRFYLFPTNYHEGGAHAAPTIPITHWCEVAHTWQTRDLDALYRLEAFVIFDRQTLETRFRFRSDQAINILAVRTYALPKPVSIAKRASYDGCRSWLSIEEEIDVEGSLPVLRDEEFRARIDSVDAVLTVAV